MTQRLFSPTIDFRDSAHFQRHRTNLRQYGRRDIAQAARHQKKSEENGVVSNDH